MIVDLTCSGLPEHRRRRRRGLRLHRARSRPGDQRLPDHGRRRLLHRPDAPSSLTGAGGDDVLFQKSNGSGRPDAARRRLRRRHAELYRRGRAFAAWISARLQFIGEDGIDFISSRLQTGADRRSATTSPSTARRATRSPWGRASTCCRWPRGRQSRRADHRAGFQGRRERHQPDLSSYLSTFTNYVPGSDPLRADTPPCCSPARTPACCSIATAPPAPTSRARRCRLLNVQATSVANVYGSNLVQLSNYGTTGYDVMIAQAGARPLWPLGRRRRMEPPARTC